MTFRQKLFTFSSLLATSLLSIAAINKLIKYNALKNKNLSQIPKLSYNWRLGDIKYNKIGSGKPILLIHDLNPYSSSLEWKKIIEFLSKNHTVYSIDLLGCGFSDKPNITYTNYLFAQLINDFIKNIIGKKTDIITSNISCSLVTMSYNIDSKLFNKIIYISPENIDNGLIIPSKIAKLYLFILNSPIIGTFIYNIASNKLRIKKLYSASCFKKYFPFLNEYFQNSKRGYSPKSLFASIKCNYININTKATFSKIDNSIFIISSNYKKYLNNVELYKLLNPSIEHFTINSCKAFPHMENPQALIEDLKLIL